MDLHKCPSGEDIEEESVEATADLHFDDLVKVYMGQLIPRDGTLYRSSPSTTTLSRPRHFADCAAHPGHPDTPADIGIERRALSTLSPRIWTTWMARNLVESTEKPGGPGMWEGEKWGMARASDTPIIVAQLAVVELLKGRGRWFGVRCRRACS